MRFFPCFAVFFACSFFLPAGVFAGDVDFSQFDKATLVILAQRQAVKIKDLEVKIEALQARLAAASGVADPVAVGVGRVAGSGSWLVTITSNPVPDISAWQAKIKSDRASAATFAESLADARDDLASLQSETKWGVDGQGRMLDVRVPKYQSADLLPYRVRIRKLQARKVGYERDAHDMQRRIDLAKRVRRLTGVRSDGLTVTIVAQGDSFAAGASLVEGRRYKLSGRGSFGKVSGTIHLASAVAVESAAVSTPAAPAVVSPTKK